MARQIDSEITDTIDNIIFYEWNGKFLMRSVQVQTEATRKAAKNYGRASNKAKVLRQLLLPLLPNPKDRDMQNRLTPAMREFLAWVTVQEISHPIDNPLTGFRFVLSSDLKECLLFPLVVSQPAIGQVRIDLPAIRPRASIAAPPGTSRVELQVMAVDLQMDAEQAYAGSAETIHIPFTDAMLPAVALNLATQAQAGGPIVVATALSYWNEGQPINQSGFMPVEIIAVFNSSRVGSV